MGMDVAFSRKDALEAGMQCVTVPNGSFNEIVDQAESCAKYDYLTPDFKWNQEQAYLEWLCKEDQCIEVPGTNNIVADGGVDCSEDIIVRANRWGRVYEPLTRWLSENDITWTEF